MTQRHTSSRCASRQPWTLLLLVALAAAACGGDEPPDAGMIEDSEPHVDAGTGPDKDQDEWLDDEDNCPDVANSEQRDRDHDGIGDACDSCPATPNNGLGGQVGQDA